MDAALDGPANVLMPENYCREPSDLPGLQLVWVREIGKFAIVRFYQDMTGGTVIKPIGYATARVSANRRLNDYQRLLTVSLATRSRVSAF